MDVKEMGKCLSTYPLHLARLQTESYRYTNGNYVLGVFNLLVGLQETKNLGSSSPRFPGKEVALVSICAGSESMGEVLSDQSPVTVPQRDGAIWS